MNWNLVADGCPIDMELVLLFDVTERMSIGYYFELNNSFIREIDGQVLTQINSWMSLPSDPVKSLEEVTDVINAMREITGKSAKL